MTKGKKLSDRHRKNISAGNKKWHKAHPEFGTFMAQNHSGKNAYWYGKNHSPKAKIAISQARFKTGKTKNVNGYIMCYKPGHPNIQPNGYIEEHRLVIEEAFGRLLSSDEHVHHINGDIIDNNIKNLMVLSFKDHMQLHKYLKKRDKKKTENGGE